MATWTVIVKALGSEVELRDLGITIPANTTITLSNFFDYSDLSDSVDLSDAVSGLTPIAELSEDGVTFLSKENAVNYLKRDNVHNDLVTHYTKTELVTPNSSVVDWTNIINAPSFGAPVWAEPVSYMITGQFASAPLMTPESVGDIYFDTANGNFYKSDGVAWNVLPGTADGQRVVDLSDGNVWSVSGITLVDGGAVADDTAVMVGDDGDGGNSQYVYSTETGGTWIKIADINFEDHLDGTAGKHKATEIVVTQDYPQLGIVGPIDLAAALTQIDTNMDIALDNNNLTGAYNQGGSGAGKTILADNGPVEFNTGSTTSTQAGFKITPVATLPTISAGGEFIVIDGLLFVYDSTRLVWLTVQRQYLTFGRRNMTKDQYLNFGAGNMPSNNSGFKMLRNGYIVGMTGQLDGVGSCKLQARRNDQTAPLHELELTMSNGDVVDNIAKEFNKGDWIQAYCQSAAGVEDVVMVVEIAYTK